MDDHDQRPDPDALLRQTQAEETQRTRAKFKIFLGYAPGVGKTYKMLELARQLFLQNIDIVIGYVELHRRYDTNMLWLGFDFLPRRRVLYRGTHLEEFDLEAALERRPQVLLLDELAHTNAPGGRHAKRWQDALDLLDAGIDVHTTLNVQHVESLNDIVAQITGVRVRETVPDSVLERADEIELVDSPPDELLARLAEGKVYVREQAARATEHFFKRGNLLALRELSLRVAAQNAGADVQEYRQAHEIEATWPTAERILVCVGPGPASARLVRAASRMAARLDAPWTAVFVEGAGSLTEADRQRLEAHLGLAESLGGESVRLSGGRVSEAILEYARQHNVTRLILGKPTHWRLRDLLRGSLLDEIVRGSQDIDVHVISGEPGSEPQQAELRKPQRSQRQGYLWAGGLVSVATVAAIPARDFLALPDLVMIYLLIIMIVAARFGRGPSVLASALSVLGYDVFFIPPYYTFAVHDQRHFFTFLMMFVVGLLISGLTSRIRRGEQEARGREVRTAALYALSRDLSSSLDPDQVAAVTAQHAAEILRAGVAVLLPNASGTLRLGAKAGRDLLLETQELGVAQWVFEHGRPAGRGTETLAGARVMCVPLESGGEALGVLALGFEESEPQRTEQRRFLEVFARQAALALERARLAEEAHAAALRARSEEMRSSLLSAVSHDLRTPLAAITGAATELRDSGPQGTEAQRRELLDTICEEAERLERLVGNLLDMTRLESGTLQVKHELVPLVEVVGSALTRLEDRLRGRPIEVELPPDLPFLSADPVLLEQVFVNLLENAAKYTPAGSPIEIRARARTGTVEVEVADRGGGLPRGREAQVFEKFFRGDHTGVGGAGLGLAICRGIVLAHGGRLVAENREGGGAAFRLSLPVSSPPPARLPSLDERPPTEVSP